MRLRHRVFISSLSDSDVSTGLKGINQYTNNAFVTTLGHRILKPTPSNVPPGMHLNINGKTSNIHRYLGVIRCYTLPIPSYYHVYTGWKRSSAG